MRTVLTIAIVIFMVALPPLVPAWTPSATLVIVLLGVLCASVLAAMWSGARATTALRIGAAVVAAVFVLAAADQLRAAIASGSPIIGGRTPIAGLVVIGIPCAIFAIRGPRRPNKANETTGDDGDRDDGWNDGWDDEHLNDEDRPDNSDKTLR